MNDLPVPPVHWRSIPNAMDHTPWYKNKGTLKLNYFLSILFVGMVLNGFDGSLISGLQAMDSWNNDLGNPGRGKIGLLNAVGAVSGLVVGPFISWVDERFGRRWGIRFYGYTMLIGSVIGCCAGLDNVDGYALFIVSRFIIGFGLTSFLMTSLVVVQEITHPRSRATVSASWDSYWILGSVCAAWVIFGCSYITTSWSWRIPYIIQVPLALYLLIGVQFVPETPRFLFAKGREDEALAFFIEYHGNGNPNDELVLFEFAEMKAAIELERSLQSQKWSTIRKSKGSLHRLALASLMAFMTSMSGASILYYYYTEVLTLVGITNATVQTGIGAGLSMFTWLFQIFGVLALKRIGSKTVLLWIWPCLLLSLIGLCVTSGVFANAGEVNNHAAVGTVVMIWVYQAFFNFSNPVLYSYPAEVQTYSIRSKGLLVWNTTSQLLSVYTTYTDSVALDRIGYKYYIVYMPLIVIQWFLAYNFMVETHSYTLEEISEAFDGPNATISMLDKHYAAQKRNVDGPLSIGGVQAAEPSEEDGSAKGIDGDSWKMRKD